MPKINIETILKITQKLPSLPQTTLQALQILEDPDYKVSELSKVIGFDQSLAVRVLQWANSPFYGIRYKVSTLDHAIMAIGKIAIRDLLLTISVSEMLNRKMPGYGMERSALWYHSIAVASGARWLAKLKKYTYPEQVFVGGLLHDIGKLVFDEVLSLDETWQEEWLALQAKGVPFMELERWLSGMDHARLGGRIAEQWNLPATLVEAISCHHEPRLATIDPPVTGWVHIADAAALMLGIGIGYDGLSYPVSEETLQIFNIRPIDLEELMLAEVKAIGEAESALMVPPPMPNMA